MEEPATDTKVWWQSMTDLERVPAYHGALATHVDKASRNGLEIEIVGLQSGTYGGRSPMEYLRSPYSFHVALEQVLANVRNAERSGYQAFAMASFVAPNLRAARSAVDIPVTSMAESVLLVASSLARQSILIAINADQARLAAELVEELGLGAHVAGVLPLDRPVLETELSQAFDQPDELLASFARVAESGIGMGADLIIPAEGILSELVHQAALHDVVGAPVIDCVHVLAEYTQMLARLWQARAVGPGRIWSYPRPNSVILEQLDSNDQSETLGTA